MSFPVAVPFVVGLGVFGSGYDVPRGQTNPELDQHHDNATLRSHRASSYYWECGPNW
jgi:hypothetical protein